ncbi:MAG TPA: sigma-54 dependent transcriptional regulator [Polyangiaceae bacterium]|nr:sigma-54 dependent transcriptional regulator [Polyangiaceae bacterium]
MSEDNREDHSSSAPPHSSPGEGPTDAGEQPAHILLFEDDETLAGLLARVLRNEGYRVDVFESARAMPAPQRVARYDVVLSDIHLAEGTSGHDVLRRVHEACPSTPVILMTAYADIEGAMNAVGEGAYDYLSKPIEPTELKRMMSEAISRRKLARAQVDPAEPRPGGAPAAADAQIVGTTPAMLTVYKTVAHVAPTTATVLIVGESGTGKELVARAIHTKSPRANKPFVAVNCGALPESILESELFGHERGSFTGASATKRGLFEEAKGGTLFLDEIGEISPKMQVQLLRVLQEGEIRRVGAAETIRVDVRVVAATNRDLKEEVATGRFREDVLFRLQVVTVHVPPLRERKRDIPLLIRHFVARHAERLGRPAPRVAPEVFDALESYAFPGNVRELSHVIERAMLLAREGVITASDLPPEVTHAWANRDAAAELGSLADDWPTLAVLERRYIDRVLSRTGGNKTRAAEVLGIDRRTLNRMFARERGVASGGPGDEETDAMEGAADPDAPPVTEPPAHDVPALPERQAAPAMPGQPRALPRQPSQPQPQPQLHDKGPKP